MFDFIENTGCFNFLFYGFIVLCFLYVFDIASPAALIAWLVTPWLVFFAIIFAVVWLFKSFFG